MFLNRKKTHVLLSALLYLNASSISFANSSILKLTDEKSTYQLEKHAFILEDKTKGLTIENILDPSRQKEFKINEERHIGFGVSRSAFWLKFSINNKSSGKNWFVEIDYRLIDKADLFLVHENEIVSKHHSGFSLPFSERDVVDKSLAFKLLLNAKTDYDLYLRVESSLQLHVPVRICTSEVFYSNNLNLTIGYVAYYVIVLVILIICIIYFVVLRDKIFIKYVLSIFSLSFGLACDNGLAYQYLWPNNPIINLYVNNFVAAAALFFFCWFLRDLLFARQYAPKADRILYFVQIASLLVAILPAFIQSGRAFQINAGVTIFGTLVLVYLGIRALKAGYKPAKYYLIGFFIFSLCVIYYALSMSNIFKTVIGPASIYIGSLVETFFFIICIAARFKMMNAQNQNYQTEKISSKDIIATGSFNQFEQLSKREQEVLEKIALGLTDKEIADQLFISITTVKTHARNIYQKLGVKNRTEAAALVSKLNLV